MIEMHLSSPTPFASAVSALSMLLVISLAVVLFAYVRRRSSNKTDKSNSTLYKITAWIGAIDKAIILAASWIIGTRYRTSYIRIPVMLVFFLALTAAAVFAPWPWGMFPIFLGVFGIFCVFRHYARHEDEIIDEVPKDSWFIKIEGHLQWEVLLAVGFLFVFAPIAFSQLQKHGYGFQIAPKAGPFTFVTFTMIETLKAGSLVDYYDLFADRIGFDKITSAKKPTVWAKWVILAYRLSLNLLMLASIKRLFDIAQRRSRGLDLRHLEEKLRHGNAADHVAVVADLKQFARQGSRIARWNAIDLLERVLQPNDREWQIGADARFAACLAFNDYDVQFANRWVSYFSAQGLQEIAAKDWTRENMPIAWARTQMELASALSSLSITVGEPKHGEAAVAAYRNALEVYTHEAMPEEWAMTQLNLGDALALHGNNGVQSEVVTAYENALEVYTREANPVNWANTQISIGDAFGRWGAFPLMDEPRLPKLLEKAAAAYRNALEVVTLKGMPTAWAETQMSLAKVLHELGDTTNDPMHLDEAVAAYRNALEVYTREEWAGAQFNIGLALSSLGSMTNDPKRLEKAVAAYRNALDGYSHDWSTALTKMELASALSSLGIMVGEPKHLDEAVEAYRTTQEIYTREDDPESWASSQSKIACCLMRIGCLKKTIGPLKEALAAIHDCLEIDPDNEDYKDALQQIEAAIEELKA